MIKLHIDFETYSEANLKDVGPWAYSKHPSTEVLMLAWAYDNNFPVIWLPSDDFDPEWVSNKLFWGANAKFDVDFQINAWNDFFELCIMKNVLDWPVPVPKYWNDTAAEAAALALPRKLEDCGEALGLSSEYAKDKKGKDLIKLFCSPKVSAKKATKGQLIRTLPADEPEKFEEFKRYCIQDVIAEREILKMLKPLAPNTRRAWELDRKINLRGVNFDMKSVRHAIVTVEKAKAVGLKKVSELTNGKLDNIASRPQFLKYVKKQGLDLENAQKEYLKRELEKLDPNLLTAQLIDLRLKLSKSSLAKYDKLINIVDESSRAYGLLRFHGASTGRWSGNLFQPQNLPRKSLDLPDLCIDLLKYEDPEIIEIFFDDCLDALTMCLRGMITASPGHRLIVSDFAQIESRVLAWLAGDEDKLDAYRRKLDIYKLNAAAAFKVKYEDVTKDQRQIGKVIELACGYQGNIGAFNQFAPVYGVVVPENEAKVLIANWRKNNPKITSYWANIEAAAVKAVAEPGTLQTIRSVSFKVIGSGHGSFLFCKLPSGRTIAYHRPRLVESKFDKYQVEFYGTNSVTKKYCRQRTYGGKLVENITQATAADCMIEKMHLIENAGYPIALTVHDELVADVPRDFGSLEDFNRIMEIVPAWAEGLPIAADGYEAFRYKK